MTRLQTVGREIVGLFVEDALFALAILVWLLVVGAIALLHAGTATANCFVLLAGLIVILVVSVYRAAR